MDCCCCPAQLQQCVCIPYGNDFCVPQQQQGKKTTMLERQGIWMQGKSVQQQQQPSPVTKYRPRMSELWRPPTLQLPVVPSVRVTKDTEGPFLSSHSNLNLHDGKIVRNTLWMTDSKYYDENRGPILRIQGRKMETVLTYKEFLKLDQDGDPIEAKMEDYSQFYPEVEDLFVYDEIEPFSTTTRCKQVKHVMIKNEGTVAVRYQWLQAPPTRALRKILGRPGSVLNVKKLTPPKENNPFFWKDTSFEFHFRQLPGVILPGQSIEFPIIFRPKRTGYFYENLYLMTHPRLSDEDDKIFHLRVSGICMEPDCPLPHSKSSMLGEDVPPTMENILKHIKGSMLYQEAKDSLNSILDTVLYDLKDPKSTLPFGKITVEQIFYAHNPDLHYHFNVAEKALENVRSLVTMLVPKDRIIDNENICPLSIKSLYSELAKSPPQTEHFWNNFKSPEAEEKLKELAESTKVLVKPRVFSWPTKETRIHSSCYTTMVATMAEIVARIENIDFDANNPVMDKVLRAEIRDKLIKKRKRAERRRLRHSQTIRQNLYDEGEEGETGMLSKGIHDDQTNSQGYKTRKSSSMNVPPVHSDTFKYQDETWGEEEEEEEGKRCQEIQYEIPEEEILVELKQLKTRKEKQGKRVLFETLFGCGVERMMSSVDSLRNIRLRCHPTTRPSHMFKRVILY